MAATDMAPRAATANVTLGGVLQPLVRMYQSAVEGYARRRAYVQTLRELESLSDRELADIGLSRPQLRDVARDSALR